MSDDKTSKRKHNAVYQVNPVEFNRIDKIRRIEKRTTPTIKTPLIIGGPGMQPSQLEEVYSSLLFQLNSSGGCWSRQTIAIIMEYCVLQLKTVHVIGPRIELRGLENGDRMLRGANGELRLGHGADVVTFEDDTICLKPASGHAYDMSITPNKSWKYDVRLGTPQMDVLFREMLETVYNIRIGNISDVYLFTHKCGIRAVTMSSSALCQYGCTEIKPKGVCIVGDYVLAYERNNVFSFWRLDDQTLRLQLNSQSKFVSIDVHDNGFQMASVDGKTIAVLERLMSRQSKLTFYRIESDGSVTSIKVLQSLADFVFAMSGVFVVVYGEEMTVCLFDVNGVVIPSGGTVDILSRLSAIDVTQTGSRLAVYRRETRSNSFDICLLEFV